MSREECPSCGSKMQGEPIPQEAIDNGYYAPGVTHYSRCMGYEERGVYDGVLIWGCPDCGHLWPRFERRANPHLYFKAQEVIARWKETPK